MISSCRSGATFRDYIFLVICGHFIFCTILDHHHFSQSPHGFSGPEWQQSKGSVFKITYNQTGKLFPHKKEKPLALQQPPLLTYLITVQDNRFKSV